MSHPHDHGDVPWDDVDADDWHQVPSARLPPSGGRLPPRTTKEGHRSVSQENDPTAPRFRSRLEQDIADELAEAERQANRTRELKVILSYLPTGLNRHAGRCPGCDCHVEAMTGNLRSVPLTGGGSRWFVVCARCETAAGQ